MHDVYSGKGYRYIYMLLLKSERIKSLTPAISFSSRHRIYYIQGEISFLKRRRGYDPSNGCRCVSNI